MKIKLSLYQYLNFILTGLIFTSCVILIFDVDLHQELIIDSLSEFSFSIETVILFVIIGIVYEFGLIINRIGSIFIEPIYKKLHFIKFNNNYKLFNERKDEYPILNDLSREYALSRTQISLFLIVAVLSAVNQRWLFLCFTLLLVVLFSISMYKHNKKIVELME
ncbi:MAG: hypothetical protein IKN56_00650 [Clostridia bacterium]|nr:hypothetical protein [Clostridia bacterium]